MWAQRLLLIATVVQLLAELVSENGSDVRFNTKNIKQIWEAQ